MKLIRFLWLVSWLNIIYVFILFNNQKKYVKTSENTLEKIENFLILTAQTQIESSI